MLSHFVPACERSHWNARVPSWSSLVSSQISYECKTRFFTFLFFTCHNSRSERFICFLNICLKNVSIYKCHSEYCFDDLPRLKCPIGRELTSRFEYDFYRHRLTMSQSVSTEANCRCCQPRYRHDERFYYVLNGFYSNIFAFLPC